MIYAHFASLPSTLAWLAAEALDLPLVVSAHARDVFVEPQLLSEKMKCAKAFFTCHSRAFFFLREGGAWYAPAFGGRGWFVLLHSAPLLLLFLVAVFALILEILVRKYSFAYRAPLRRTCTPRHARYNSRRVFKKSRLGF